MNYFKVVGAYLCLILLFLAEVTNAQNDCPSLPSRAKFDTLGYISANIPTDPSKASGKLYLAQGWAQRGAQVRPGFIPTNKPSWAIAIAVAWNLARNLNQRVEYPNINYWMATLIQETELRCATGMTWSDPSHFPDAYNPATVYAAQINNGCLQIEGPGSAWSALQQAYPNGRIPFDNTLYDQLIEGVDGFESSALVKTYYDGYTSQIFNYNVGWDFYNNVDCKRQHDPYAYEKMSASNYNAGPNGFLNNAGIINNTGPGCWTGLAATTAGYGNDIAKWISVLDGNTGYCEYPGGASAKGPDYNGAVPYSEVTKYLNIIKPMYPDVNFATDLIPYVEAAFIGKAGSLAGTINFEDFGDVIDAIVLHLPMDKPTPVDGSPIGINLGCSGDFLPYGHVDILNGGTNMCLGKSVTLELSVDAGNDPNIQFKWFKGDPVSGTLISTNKIVTITPTAVGTEVYSGQICNANGCYTVYSNTQNACQDSRNLNGFNIVTRDCNLCPFVASGTSVNAVCKGTPDGSITLNLVNAPANYEVSYVATTPVGNDTATFQRTGNTVTISGVRDGAYNFTLTDLSDPTCQAYTTVIVGYDTEINEYIDAELLAVANCNAGVKADIKELPAPCLWKVQVHTPIFFQWEAWVNAVVKTSTGKDLIQKQTRISPKPEFDQYNNVPISEFYLSLNTGDQITVGTALTTTPGAQQLRAYEFNIFDEADTKVYTATSAAGASTFGNNDIAGTYTVTCPQTVPNYTIAWSPSINNEVTTPITSSGDVDVFSTTRVYTVSATNNANPQCVLKDSVIVVGDPNCSTTPPCTKPTLSVSTPDTALCSGDTAQYRMVFTGASPYTLYYSLGGQKDTITGIATDFYNLPVSVAGTLQIDSLVDADCRLDTSISRTITVNPLPVISELRDTTLCGSSYTLDAGTDIITGYVWNENPAENGQTYTVTTTGTNEYRVEVTTTNNCIARDTVSVTLNPTPTAVDLQNASICAADLPYTLDATLAGVTYLWNDNSMNPTLDVTTAGDYFVIVSSNGCSDTDSVAITIGTPSIDLGLDTTHCGTSLTLDAGTGYASYSWNESVTDVNQTLSVTTSGEYRIAATLPSGCIARDTINVTLNPIPVAVDLPDTTLCATALPYTLDATLAGVTYLWNDNSMNPTLDVNAAGDYFVIVSSNGCNDTDSVSITVSSAIQANLGNDTTLCGTSFTLDAGAGYAGYSWNESATDVNQTLVVSSTGEYRIAAVTASGCVARDTINVTINPYPTVDIGDLTTTCTGVATTLDATTAGATYLWNNNTTNATLSTSTEGDYWVKVTVNGCSDSDSVYVQVSSQLNVNIGPDTVICPGESYTLRSNLNLAGATYTWGGIASGNGTTAVVNTAGQATLQVSVGGCSGDTTMNLSIDNPLTIDLGAARDTCQGESLKLQLLPARTGLNYQWSTGSTDSVVFATTSGNYTLDVDSAGCTASDNVDITIHALPVIDLGLNTFVCVGSGATINLDAGTTVTSYLWDDASTGQTRVVSAAGKYYVDGTDANGCTATDTIQVEEKQASPFELLAGIDDTTICPAGSAVFSVPVSIQVPNTSFVWENNNMSTFTYTVSNQVDGYTEDVILHHTNLFGCVSSDTVTVNVNNQLALPGLQSEAICAGDNITFRSNYTTAGGYTFEWNGNPANSGETFPITNATAADAGNITLHVESSEGCSGDSTVTLIVNPTPQTTIATPPTLCTGSSVTLSHGLGAGYTSLWSTGGTTQSISVNSGGSYNVIIRNVATTCDTTIFTSVNETAPPVVNLGPDSTKCVGETKTLLDNNYTTAAYTYQWSGSGSGTNSSIAVTSNGTYTLTVTEVSSGCSSQPASVTYSFVTPPVADIQVNGSSVDTVHACEGESVSLVSANQDLNYDYYWGGLATGATYQVSQTGAYVLNVVAGRQGQCPGTDTAFVVIHTPPSSQLIPDTIVCFEDLIGDTMRLEAGGRGLSYLWNTGDTTSGIRIEERGVYSVTITDSYGCITQDEVSVQEDCIANVWIPNSFTPDGDGVNETWGVSGRGIESLELFVYNRWGQLVWQTTTLDDLWNGTFQNNGQELGQDVYIWKLTYTYNVLYGGERSRKATGTVTIIR